MEDWLESARRERLKDVPAHVCGGGNIWCSVCGMKLPGVGELKVGFAYPWNGGGEDGRRAFKGPTIKERQEKAIKEAHAQGRDPVPVGTRWV